MAIGFWGYPNGKIPTSAMYAIVSRGGTFYLREDAAYWWWRLSAEYGAVWGVPLEITDAYRSLAEQQYYWDAFQAGWGNVASPPGQSNHGWACAVDIYTPSYGDSSSTPQHAWLRENAPKFGWTWTTGKASGESWHWEFTEGLPIPAGLDAQPLGDEIDMASIAELKELMTNLIKEIVPGIVTELVTKIVRDIVTRERARLFECREHQGEEYVIVNWHLPTNDPSRLVFPKTSGQIGSLENNYQYLGDDEVQAKQLTHDKMEGLLALALGITRPGDPTPLFDPPPLLTAYIEKLRAS